MAPRETEIKLEADPRDAAAIRAGVEHWLGPPSRVVRLVSRYHDTAAADLRVAGLTLRVRKSGGGFVQTVKRSGDAGGGLFRRDEWETPVSADRPDPEAARTTPLGAALEAAAAPLAEVFRSDVERALWDVRRPGGVVEVAMDLGSVLTDDRVWPLLELELELKEGEPAAVLDLLGDVPAEVGLTVGVLTKSERGFLLTDGRGGQSSFKAEPVALRPAMPTRDAVQAILRSCLRQIRLNEPGVMARDAKALHQARVGLRRLRSAFSLFSAVLDDDRFEGFATRFREVSTVLGDVRNLDVVIDRLDDRQESGDAGLRALLRHRRREAYDAVTAAMERPSYPALLRDLLGWIEGGAWLGRPACREPIEKTAAAVLDRCRRQIRRLGRGLRRMDPGTRHRVRIAGKKLRYATDFVAALAIRPEQRRRHEVVVAALERLQDALGRLNDMQTAKAIGDGFEGIAGRSSLLPDEDVDALLTQAVLARRALVAAKRFWRGWT